MITRSKIDHLFIVGAGFSNNAGLPLTSEFTDKLLDVDGLKLDGPSALQVAFLKKFVTDTFELAPDTGAELWPQLEDIFTCIDLSANTGHHLGPQYSPSQLRTVRRALIVRIIRMLRYCYTSARDTPNAKWKRLEQFFKLVDIQNTAFLSMNWDTVIESGLARTQKIKDIDYGCDAIAAAFAATGSKIFLRDEKPEIQILKPHGSTNWLYCDACRQIFWFSVNTSDRIAAQLFRRSDWNVIKQATGNRYRLQTPSRKCPICDARALGTRFATFSYRKALDFAMHELSWHTAERLLREAKNWIFIGYSLPAADYEFKLLLKRVCLSRRDKPNLVLITGGSPNAVAQTRLSYQRFFGQGIGPTSSSIYKKGLDATALAGLKSLGYLMSR